MADNNTLNIGFKSGLNNALSNYSVTKNLLGAKNYDGQQLYEDSLKTDRGSRTKNMIGNALADLLTFGVGAMTNLYSPAGLAAGASAVWNRHSGMNAARNDYANKLNNNLLLYDYMGALNPKLNERIPKNKITGYTDMSKIYPGAEKMFDQDRIQQTVANLPSIIKNGKTITEQTYADDGYNSGTNTTTQGGSLPPVPTIVTPPTVNELKLETPETAPNAPETNPNINVNYTPGAYGTLGQEEPLINQQPLQANVQQNDVGFLVDPELLKYGMTYGQTNVKNAKGEKENYYKANLAAETSRENNIRSTNASIANNIRSTNASILNNLAKSQNTANNSQGKADAKELAKQQELAELQQQLNNFQDMFDKVPNKLRGATTGAARRLVGLASNNEANFDAQRTLLFNQIARKLGGEKGVLSDYDIKRIEKALPTLSDSFEQRNAKMKAVYDLLDIKKGAAGNVAPQQNNSGKTYSF